MATEEDIFAKLDLTNIESALQVFESYFVDIFNTNIKPNSNSKDLFDKLHNHFKDYQEDWNSFIKTAVPKDDLKKFISAFTYVGKETPNSKISLFIKETLGTNATNQIDATTYYHIICEIYRTAFIDLLNTPKLFDASKPSEPVLKPSASRILTQDAGKMTMTFIRTGKTSPFSNVDMTASSGSRGSRADGDKKVCDKIARHCYKCLLGTGIIKEGEVSNFAALYKTLNKRFEINVFFNSFSIYNSWFNQQRTDDGAQEGQDTEYMEHFTIMNKETSDILKSFYKEQIEYSLSRIVYFSHIEENNDPLLNIVNVHLNALNIQPKYVADLPFSKSPDGRLGELRKKVNEFYQSMNKFQNKKPTKEEESKNNFFKVYKEFCKATSELCLYTEDAYLSVGAFFHVLYNTQNNFSSTGLVLPKEFYIMSIFDNIGMMLEYALKYQQDLDKLDRPFRKYLLRAIHAYDCLVKHHKFRRGLDTKTSTKSFTTGDFLRLFPNILTTLGIKEINQNEGLYIYLGDIKTNANEHINSTYDIQYENELKWTFNLLDRYDFITLCVYLFAYFVALLKVNEDNYKI